MAIDVNLVLCDEESFVAGTNNTSPVYVSGGFRADVRVRIPAIATTGDTLDLQVQASRDGGSNFFQIADFPQIVDTEDDIEIARSCYIPRPETPGVLVQVRLQVVISTGGSATLFAVIEPLDSIAVKEIDESLSIGLAKLT